MRRRVEPSSPPPASSCGLGDLLRPCLLHGAHVEIEHALALVALFLVLFSELDDLFQNLYVESVAFGLRKHFLLCSLNSSISVSRFSIRSTNARILPPGMVTSDMVPP